MSEQDDAQERAAEPVRKLEPEAETFLRKEFANCRAALLSWQEGPERVRQAQRAFDDAWTGVIRNAVRVFGRDATREALSAMGRAEDVAKMY